MAPFSGTKKLGSHMGGLHARETHLNKHSCGYDSKTKEDSIANTARSESFMLHAQRRSNVCATGRGVRIGPATAGDHQDSEGCPLSGPAALRHRDDHEVP